MYYVRHPYLPPPYYRNIQNTYNYFPRQYSSVDPTLFTKSASEMQTLMSDASIILGRLSQSKQFASQVMTAAQQSDQAKVNALLKSTGIQSIVQAEYNPDRLLLKLSSAVYEVDCCILTISLRWRN
ncbi:hypothetical protein ACWE42_20305 [Sutcliffiella cohnii]